MFCKLPANIIYKICEFSYEPWKFVYLAFDNQILRKAIAKIAKLPINLWRFIFYNGNDFARYLRFINFDGLAIEWFAKNEPVALQYLKKMGVMDRIIKGISVREFLLSSDNNEDVKLAMIENNFKSDSILMVKLELIKLEIKLSGISEENIKKAERFNNFLLCLQSKNVEVIVYGLNNLVRPN